MADKYLAINNSTGRRKEVEGTVTSAGAGNAGDLVALDSSGRLDDSVLPLGVGAEVTVAEASESLSAGDFVNLHLDTTLKVRKADNSNGRQADGFVTEAYSSSDPATVYREGVNAELSTLTINTAYFLGTGGAVTATPPTSGLLQELGKATSTTELYFSYQEPTER